MPYNGGMDKARIIETQIDARTFADLERLARRLDASIDHLITTAIMRFVDEEVGVFEEERLPGPPSFATLQPELAPLDDAAEAMHAFLRKGLDDLEAGRVIPHEDVMRELRARHRARSAA